MKKRLLVPISISFSIRYIIRTGLLERLREFCEPIIAFTWNDDILNDELKALGYEVHIIPPPVRQPAYNDARRKIDFWFNEFQLKSPSTKIQKRYLRHILPEDHTLLAESRRIYNYFKSFIPGNTKKLFDTEQTLLLSHTNLKKIQTWLNQLHVDAVFTVTPFHRQEDLLLRAAKLNGKKMYTAILSFDNLTKRGWIPVEYDAYMLWNNKNCNELKRIYPHTKNKHITITGAPQFDFYFDKKYVYEKDEWKTLCGLPLDDRRIILYSGGPQVLFPQEPQYLKHLLEAIDEGKIKNDPIILFRCHPIDHIDRWKNAVGPNPHLFYEESWTGREDIHQANITLKDIKKLCSTLAYTDVHINVCSTMTIDGSAFGKPQIWPAYIDEDPVGTKLLQEMYRQEHFLSILQLTGDSLCCSKEAYIHKVQHTLNNLFEKKSISEDLLKSVITFTDGQSMERVAMVLQNEMSQHPNDIQTDGGKNIFH
ncbi:MAG: hypothetical protein JSS67_10780 [Bacteroidetes bacterium]|nr:hypothetical protein [Bacteroidota bacterium]